MRRGPRVGAEPQERIEVGALVVDIASHQVAVDGRAVELSAREFGLLQVLVEQAGRVVTRRKLFDTVWGPDFFGDERALDVYIRLLRKKIEADPDHPTSIRTVRGVGYRFALPEDAK